MEPHRMRGVYFNRESGHVLSPAAVKVVDAAAPVYGKRGVSWKHKKKIMRRRVDVLVGPLTQIIGMLRLSQLGH